MIDDDCVRLRQIQSQATSLEMMHSQLLRLAEAVGVTVV
jgi:hypothetical protein